MKTITIQLILLISLGLGLLTEINAQSVPAAVKREITSILKQHDSQCENPETTISVESVKLTPRKTGYMGSCRYGGGPTVLFEKTTSGFRKLIAVDTGMNGYLYSEKRVTKGYYDFSHSERGGNEVGITTYKWNGTRYIEGRERIEQIQ